MLEFYRKAAEAAQALVDDRIELRRGRAILADRAVSGLTAAECADEVRRMVEELIPANDTNLIRLAARVPSRIPGHTEREIAPSDMPAVVRQALVDTLVADLEPHAARLCARQHGDMTFAIAMRSIEECHETFKGVLDVCDSRLVSSAHFAELQLADGLRRAIDHYRSEGGGDALRRMLSFAVSAGTRLSDTSDHLYAVIGRRALEAVTAFEVNPAIVEEARPAAVRMLAHVA